MGISNASMRLFYAAILGAVLFAGGVPCAAVGVIVEERLNFRSTVGSPGVTSGDTGVIPPSDFPPDTNGAVGPNHIVEVNKKEFLIYDKSGQLVFANLLDGFWNSVLSSPVEGTPRKPDGQNKSFDPRILYDEGIQRWIAVSMSSEHRLPQKFTNRLLVAVSDSANPQGTWSANVFTADPLSNDNWADFPRVGVNRAGVTVATTPFDLAKNQNTGLQNIYVFSMDQIVNNNTVMVGHRSSGSTKPQRRNSHSRWSIRILICSPPSR